MKELTIEEKAQRYDEAIAWLEKQERIDSIVEKAKTEKQRVIITETNGDANIDWDTRSLEDARRLLECGLQYISTELKKQGENNMGISEATKQKLEDNLNKALEKETPESCNEFLEKQGEQNPIDKVESKFHEGDWIVTLENKVLQITSIEGTSYRFNNESHYWEICYCDEQCRLWTIQDAKDGDVLACGNDIVIFKENNYNPKDKSGCMFVYCSCNNFYEIGGINPTDYKPATKEQRDLLFQKMKEAGYEWDAEKKELKKIGNEIEIPFGAKDSELQEVTYYIPKGFHAEIDGDKVVIKKGEKPIAWSEEDERIYRSIKYSFAYNFPLTIQQQEFVKSLKDRVQLQNLVFTDEELAQGKKDAYNDALDKIEYRSDVPTFDDGWTAAIDFIRKKTI